MNLPNENDIAYMFVNTDKTWTIGHYIDAFDDKGQPTRVIIRNVHQPTKAIAALAKKLDAKKKQQDAVNKKIQQETGQPPPNEMHRMPQPMMFNGRYVDPMQVRKKGSI